MLYISTGAGHLLLYVYICIFSLLFVSILMKFLLCNLYYGYVILNVIFNIVLHIFCTAHWSFVEVRFISTF